MTKTSNTMYIAHNKFALLKRKKNNNLLKLWSLSTWTLWSQRRETPNL